MKRVLVICGALLFLAGLLLSGGCLHSNLPPVAAFSYVPSSGNIPLTVSFDGTASDDPDGSVVSYAWDFGDGETGSGATTSHTYGAAGMYTPVLTVTDNNGAADSTSTTIHLTESMCKDCVNIVEWQFGPDARGAPAVTGVARNECSYALSYTELFAHFYDADDIEIGTYWDIMAGVLPEEEWEFQIECPISAVWPYVDHASIEVHACTPAL